MSKHYSIAELKNEIASLKSVTPWDMLEVNSVYHIPPITSLQRRDILIISKDENILTYCKIGDKEKEERNMAKTSVFAKFLVKRRKY